MTGKALVLLGMFMTAISAICIFTPLHWWLNALVFGHEDNFYPELFWIFFGMPISLTVLLTGIVVVLLRKIRD
jgi:hypothetical protein